jgi:hypothetical protein
MTTVDFVTFCHKKHIHKLHESGVLLDMVASHGYPFDNTILIHQRCRNVEYRPIAEFPVRIIESESHPNILTEFNIGEDAKADHYTHGPNASHYWKWHVINHLIGLKESRAGYIVFSDCDCTIKESDPNVSWVEEGIRLLQQYPQILIVSPGDGGEMFESRVEDVRLTQNVSQQVFLCHRHTLRHINFGLPWDWEYLAPGAPFQEYYYMLEGRIWRWLYKHNLYRAILSDKWRYWHWQW